MIAAPMVTPAMRRTVVAGFLAVVLVLVPLAPGTAATIEKPAYARGDTWTYRTTLAESLGVFDGNMTTTAGDEINLTVQGESVHALELSVDGEGSFSGTFESFGVVRGSWTITGAEHWESQGWEVVRSFVRLSAAGSLEGGPQPVPFTFQLTNETTQRLSGSPPSWPLRSGASVSIPGHWNESLNLSVRIQGGPPQGNTSWIDGDFVTRRLDNGTETVVVPAGTFTADRIEEILPENTHRVRWFSPRAGNDVREEDYNATGDRIALLELSAFRYAAGEPPPPFPWLLALNGALAVSAIVLFCVLLVRRRAVARTPPERSP